MTSAAADSARCRNGGVRADSARCAPVPSPSAGAVVAMARTRWTMIASKAKAKHLFCVEQTAKTRDSSLSSTNAMSKHFTHCKGTPPMSAILLTGSPGVYRFPVRLRAPRGMSVWGSQRLRVRSANIINHLEGIAVRQSDSDANLFITGIKRHSFKTGFVKMRKHAVSLKSESEDCGHVRISIESLLYLWAKDFRVRRRRLLRYGYM